MTVEQADIVDGLGVDKGSGSVVLMISDHLPWDDAHLLALKAKLTTYMGFIQSGQLAERLPGNSNRKVEIRLVCKYCPDAKATAFLDVARQAALDQDVELKCTPLLDAGYSDDQG